MKKMRKISVLALLMAGFTLAFVGCSNGTSEKPNDQKQDNQQEQEGKDEDKKQEAPKALLIGVSANEGYSFNDLKIRADAYTDVVNKVDADGVLVITQGEEIAGTDEGWHKIYICFNDKVDLSKYTKLTVTAKCSEDYKKGDAVTVEVASGCFGTEDQWHNIEYVADGASGVSTYTDNGKFLGDLTTTFKTFSIETKNFSSYYKDKMSVYTLRGDTKADMTAIEQIGIGPRGALGKIYIQSIKFE